MLDIFDQTGKKGTFFILGSVARRCPDLIREIQSRGHEIASHGYGHQIAYLQNKRQFFRDVRRTKCLLEDLTGQAVVGYRAPNFSITERNPWAHEELRRAGYRYDSSVYPIWHPRYANLATSLTPYLINTNQGPLVEIPLAVRREKFMGFTLRIPVAGGAYWRLFPPLLIELGLRRIRSEEKRPACCYLHPWEVDIGQPKLPGIGGITWFRHFGGTTSLAGRLQVYLARFGSVSIHDMMQLHYPELWDVLADSAGH